MQYYEVKIRETKTLVPRDDGSTFWPEKHGKLIKVDVYPCVEQVVCMDFWD